MTTGFAHLALINLCPKVSPAISKTSPPLFREQPAAQHGAGGSGQPRAVGHPGPRGQDSQDSAGQGQYQVVVGSGSVRIRSILPVPDPTISLCVQKLLIALCITCKLLKNSGTICALSLSFAYSLLNSVSLSFNISLSLSLPLLHYSLFLIQTHSLNISLSSSPLYFIPFVH